MSAIDETWETYDGKKKLYPFTTTISRARGEITYTFGIDALFDDVGQVYYSSSEIKRIEEEINKMEKEFKEWNPH